MSAITAAVVVIGIAIFLVVGFGYVCHQVMRVADAGKGE